MTAATVATTSRRSFSSWAPATNKTVVEKKDPTLTKDSVEGVAASSSSLSPSNSSNSAQQSSESASASAPLSSSPVHEEAHKSKANTPQAEDATNAVTPDPTEGEWWGTANDACRCRHLEEFMFPRSLTLDCQRLDDFCTGCVKDTKNLGRIYMEALHLKEFLKSPETILASRQTNNAPGKRGRKGNADITVPPKKKGRPSKDSIAASKRAGNDKTNNGQDEHVTDNGRLAQSYLGGLEGKRTWFLANSNAIGKGGGLAGSYCPALQPSSSTNDHLGMEVNSNISSDNKVASGNDKRGNKGSSVSSPSEFDGLLSSEMKLTTLRKLMRLQDNTVPLSETSEINHPEAPPSSMSLESLVKPLPGYKPPATLSGTSGNGGVPDSPVSSSSAKTSDKRKDASQRIKKEKRSSIKPEKSHSSNSAALMKKLGNASTKSNNNPESKYDRALREGNETALAANMLLESFRRNRRNYWEYTVGKKKGKGFECAWCPSSVDCSSGSNIGSQFEFGVIKCNRAPPMDEGATGDALIECLECGLVGCGPRFLNGDKKSSKKHIMLHFLMSGHRFGVTCGPLGELYCFGCGDVVYHECFDLERERSFLEQNIPSLCWKETPILRGVDPSSFIVTPENGVVWRGMMATYPAPVSTQLVQASRFAAKRLSIFRGDVSIEMGMKGTELSVHRQLHLKDRWIPSPVGIYNLGNSCYMSATLQCMLNCKPLQDLFLRDLIHPYQSCECLRFGSNKTSCLACEMDKILLEYYGSAVGIDAIAALEDQFELSLDKTHTPVNPENRGHPIIPSNLLAEIWKNRGMKHISGHNQHDAQEFFNAFVDCLATHVLAYQKSAQTMRQIMHETQVKHSTDMDSGDKSGTDFLKKIFMGTLRSVLICQECGCKRTQTESFSNVSLPLAKEIQPSDPETRTSRRGKISVRSVLEHFTRPEALADPVLCPSCNTKTKTLKQHTFSKLPQVLCLHLKRFDASANKKITDFVSFPAYGLDMGKHLPHWCEQGLEVKDTNNNRDQSAKSPKVLYDLFGTVNHKGTLHQGHYVANVKSGKRWYTCNDAFVSTAGEGNGVSEVLSSAGAYMLFYVKR